MPARPYPIPAGGIYICTSCQVLVEILLAHLLDCILTRIPQRTSAHLVLAFRDRRSRGEVVLSQ